MRRLFVLALAAGLSLGLAACTVKSGPAPSNTGTGTPEATAPDTAKMPSDQMETVSLTISGMT